MLTSAVPLGAGIGAFSSKEILKIMGRRDALMIADIVGIAST